MAIKKTARQTKNEAHMLAIQEASFRLFSEYSFAQVTVDDICTEAGINKSTFYNLYKSKEDLLMVATSGSRISYIREHFQFDDNVPIRELFSRFFVVNYEYVLQSPREFTRSIYKGYMSTGNIMKGLSNDYTDILYRLIDRAMSEHKIRTCLSREDNWRIINDSLIGCFVGYAAHIDDEPGLDEQYMRMMYTLAEVFVGE